MTTSIVRTMAAVAWIFTTASASAETADLGDLIIPYDSEFWRFEKDGARMSLQQVKDVDGDLAIDISVGSGTAAMCSQQAMAERQAIGYPDDRPRQTFTVKRDRFDLHVALVELGCRNWTGSPVHACTFYRGRLYTFSADPGGCDTPPLYDEPVLEVLYGITTP